MLPLTTPNPLLQNIQNAIKEVMPAGRQAISSGLMTDEIRRDILNILVTHSDNISHPGEGVSNGGDLDSKFNSDNGAHDRSYNNSTDPHSRTLIRWQILAYVAGIDLTLAKWFESHLDALSILQEVGYDKPVQGLWAVWASEGLPLRYQQGAISKQGSLTGIKAWCSGAHIVDYGLMTYRDDNGDSQLVIVNMQENGVLQQGIKIDSSAWQAVGMQATDTATLQFNQVAVSLVGLPNAYLERVGFWHGAAGVAACWYGATSRLAAYLVTSYQQKPNDYKAMYLGEISTSLTIAQQYFHHTALLIDSQPKHNHELTIRQLRANVEQLARHVLETVGQALGAAPFCRDAHFARLAADLPVFIRQSHGAFDLQKIGELTSEWACDASKDFANNLMDGQVNIWQL